MGCECLRPKEIEKEIQTFNTEKYYIHNIKNDKKKEIETYINTIKTSDKNTFHTNINNDMNQPIKNNNNHNLLVKNEKYHQIVNISKNISNEESSKKTLDNNNGNKTNKNRNTIQTNKDTTIKKKPKSLVVHNKNKFEEKSNKKIKNNKKNKNKHENKSKMPTDEFSKYIFEHINMLRENPKYFIKNIEEAKSFIARNKDNKLIYKKKIKVLLSQGLLAFEEAIAILQFCKPMNKLIYEPNLVVKLPKSEDDIKNKDYFRNEIKHMIEKGIPIQAYWRDIIKEPETSFLMMVIDDTGIKSGLKRKDILDPNKKYIGISSISIGKHFVCFLTFSNSKS
jgi:hypothetical protein